MATVKFGMSSSVTFTLATAEPLRTVSLVVDNRPLRSTKSSPSPS